MLGRAINLRFSITFPTDLETTLTFHLFPPLLRCYCHSFFMILWCSSSGFFHHKCFFRISQACFSLEKIHIRVVFAFCTVTTSKKPHCSFSALFSASIYTDLYMKCTEIDQIWDILLWRCNDKTARFFFFLLYL